jgi:glycosyltransferase involved in cell wall biosynthesis
MVRYAVEITEGLAELPELELHVLARRSAVPFFTGIIGDARRVHAVPEIPTTGLSAMERMGLGIPALRRPMDVVHGTKHLLPATVSGFKVLTVHDMLIFDRPQDYPMRKRVLMRRPYLGSIRDAGVLVCVSDATRQRLLTYVPSANAKAVVVPSAVSGRLLIATPRSVPELEGRRFALVVGDASPRKNLRLVVDSWADVVADAPDAILAVVGPAGWGLVERGHSYHELHSAGSLAALGHVDDSQLRWCYEHAAVVLCPSLQEGFGLPAVEALAFGAPVITSDDAALCEVTQDAALHLSTSDRRAWVAAIREALVQPGRGFPAATSIRTWVDVARETVDSVLVFR